ncbi:MAG TPA: GyrI-like domain-containing protein [Gemmatimonadaceae bacterium]|nr:GyrI-like domain-containing protein [Gemmatimonadaceae bacterium]
MLAQTIPETVEVTTAPTTALLIDRTCPSNASAISAAMAGAFSVLADVLVRSGLTASGPPRAIYTAMGPAEVRFTAAIPIRPVRVLDDRETGAYVGTIRGERALRFVHHGPHDALRDTYFRIEDWLRERGQLRTAADWDRFTPRWEEFLGDPDSTPPEELVTRIYLTLH